MKIIGRRLLIIFVVATLLWVSNKGNSKAPSTPIIYTPTRIKISTPTKTPIPQISVGTVLVKSINVRSGPGRNYEAISFINQGGEFYILGEESDSANQKWLRTPSSKDSFGWILGESYYVNQKWTNVDNSMYTLISNLYGASIYRMLLDYGAGRPATTTQSVLFCANTNNYVGNIITCKMPKAYCSYQPATDGSPTFCNDAPYPNHNFTLLVWGEDWSDYDGECVIVSGVVSIYQGKPQIEVSDRSSVTLCQ